MLNDYNQDQLDYNMILLKHLDRISILSTIIREDPQYVDVSDTAKRSAYLQAIYSLKALIPESMKDKQYYEDLSNEIKEHNEKINKKEYDENQRGELDFYHRFNQLGIIVNLLNRKGLILSRQLPGRKGKKKTQEVFEE